MKYKTLGMILLAMSLINSAHSARIVDETNHKAVNRVKWTKQQAVDATATSQQQLAQGVTSVFLLDLMTMTVFKPVPILLLMTVFRRACNQAITAMFILVRV